MNMVIWAAAGGAIGASARYLTSVAMARLLGPAFPWGTLTVNIAGCFLMGLLIEIAALRLSLSNEMRTFLATGILGGFTTFSAFALDFAVLWERKETAAALGYAGASVLFSVLGLFLGLMVVRLVLE